MDTEVLLGRPARRAAPRRIAWLLLLVMSSHDAVCEEQREKNKDGIDMWQYLGLLFLANSLLYSSNYERSCRIYHLDTTNK